MVRGAAIEMMQRLVDCHCLWLDRSEVRRRRYVFRSLKMATCLITDRLLSFFESLRR